MQVAKEIRDVALRLGNGQHKKQCPECQNDRSGKNQADRPLSIKIDTTGLISMKGMGSDIHTLLKKLSMALQNMTHPTPAGPSGPATNMSEIIQFDLEIDKVFQA